MDSILFRRREFVTEGRHCGHGYLEMFVLVLLIYSVFASPVSSSSQKTGCGGSQSFYFVFLQIPLYTCVFLLISGLAWNLPYLKHMLSTAPECGKQMSVPGPIYNITPSSIIFTAQTLTRYHILPHLLPLTALIINSLCVCVCVVRIFHLNRFFLFLLVMCFRIHLYGWYHLFLHLSEYCVRSQIYPFKSPTKPPSFPYSIALSKAYARRNTTSRRFSQSRNSHTHPQSVSSPPTSLLRSTH